MPPLKSDESHVEHPFWMIQSSALTPGAKDKFGRQVLYWPGRSVFKTKEEAEQGAAVLATEHPGTTFFVMASTEGYYQPVEGGECS